MGSLNVVDFIMTAIMLYPPIAEKMSGIFNWLFQVGTGEAIGRNYIDKQLPKSGINIKADGALGLLDSIDLDYKTITGNDKWKPPNQADYPNQAAYDRAMTQANAQMEAKIKGLGLDGLATASVGDGKIKFDMTKFKGMRYETMVKTLYGLDEASGGRNLLKKLGAQIKIRNTLKMSGIFSWLHPIENLKSKMLSDIQAKIKELSEKGRTKAQQEELKAKKQYDKTVDPDTGETEVARDGDNKPLETKESADGTAKYKDITETEIDRLKAKAGRIGKAFKIAGGISIGVGIAGVLTLAICQLLAAENAHLEEMVALEQTGLSMYQESQSVWGQIQAAGIGEDVDAIDANVLSVLHKKNLYDPAMEFIVDADEDFENVVTETAQSMWTGSARYQWEIEGNLIPREDTTPEQVAPENIYNKTGGWAAVFMSGVGDSRYTDAFIINPADAIDAAGKLLCNEVANVIMTVLGSLDVVGFIMTAIMMYPPIAEKMSGFFNWLFQVGTGVVYDAAAFSIEQNTETAGIFGNHRKMVAQASFGAGVVSAQAAYENRRIAQEYLDAEWQARPLAERLFDATDYRSTVARVVNGARINTMPSNAKEYFANFAKLVGAVPNFIFGGLFKNKSAEAMAATATIYDAGAPLVELDLDWMDKISGDETYDYDENFEAIYDYLADSSKKLTFVESHNVDVNVRPDDIVKCGLLAKWFSACDYTDDLDVLITPDIGDLTAREYAQNCLGNTIGDEASGYAVKAFESDEPKEALLVGMKGGTWDRYNCEERAKYDDYRRIGLYVMDYWILAGYAWYSSDDSDPETIKIADEIFGDAAANSGGDGSGSSGDGSGDGSGSGGETSGGDGSTGQKTESNCLRSNGQTAPSVALNSISGVVCFDNHVESFYDQNMNTVMANAKNGDAEFDNCSRSGHYNVENELKKDDDGYILVAANFNTHPRCSTVNTSLGMGKVYDGGDFAATDPWQIDVATDWGGYDTASNGV